MSRRSFQRQHFSSFDPEFPDLRVARGGSSAGRMCRRGRLSRSLLPGAAEGHQRDQEGQSKAGDHAYVWDGRGLSGQALPDGVYTLRITTRDASGASIAAGSVYLEGPVSAVERSGGDTLLTINGARAPLSSVIAVTQLPNTGASNSSSASDTSTPAGQTPASAA